jgi:signal transduction histidine kinase/ActR/RegA family two-component response regulator
LISLTDITERVQVEEERSRLLVQIQEQARQIQQVMNTVPEGVLLLDPTGRVMLANPLAERELTALANAGVGDTLTQLGGRPLAELLVPAPDGLRHELKVDSPQARTFELSARPIDFSPDRMPSARESEGWVLVIRDVTQEREIEQRVQQQERLAAVGQLAAGIAHDFNNILAVIVLYTQMGLRMPELPQELRHRLETVEHQAKRATDLIQQILDFSRKAILEQQPLDLKLFMNEQVKLLQRTVPENIQIKLTHGADEYTVNADPTRMQQVIVNLAVNARDAMPDGGKLDIALSRTSYTDEITCTTCAQVMGGEWVQLAIRDNGTGIPADVLPHIFEPFFTTKEVGKGAGLGLAQVYGTVKQHEGHIEVTSTVGEGTSFAIHLPALLLIEPKTLIQDEFGLIHGRGETVLLVEDNPVMQQAMLDSLESLNYQVLRASSGREALAVFAGHREEIDLVLSDLVMPEIGGMALFQALKIQEPAIKMILISGYPLHQEIEDLQAQGIVDWLQKPVNLDHLAQVIARALDQD